VTPLVPVLLGLVALGAGVAILRSFGPRYQVGRLLSATPGVSVAQAVAIAGSGAPARYVRITGRIDADTDFEDDAHRPLVFRRTRLDIRDGSSWRSFDDRREAVPFEITEGLDAIGVHHDDLDAGLIVLPRESVGTAADVPDRVPAGTDPAVPIRLLVQHVSTVEHAIVVGVPALNEAGAPQMAAGLGRPLILTTLQTDEAMRILAADHARRPLAAALALAVGLLLITTGIVWAGAEALL
jgi:hypothetical protein